MKVHPYIEWLVIRIDRKHDAFTKMHFKTIPDKTTRLQIINHYIMEANNAFAKCEDYIMAKTKRNKKNDYGVEFAHIALDSAAKADAVKWLKSAMQDAEHMMTEMIHDGWKLSVSFDEYNDCFIGSITMRDDNDINYGTCVTSRSDNMLEAVLLSYYKAYILFEGKKLPTEAAKQNWG